MSLSALVSTTTFSSILYTITAFTLPIHLFGGYCILFKTPNAMKSVKWTLFNLQFWSMCLDLLISFFGQPFLYTPGYAGVSLGVLDKIGVSTWVTIYLGMTLFVFVGIATVSIFENRYYLIFAKHTWRRFGRYPFFLLNYIYSLTYYIPTIRAIPSQEIGRKEIFKLYPHFLELDSQEHPAFVVTLGDPLIVYRQLMVTALVVIEMLVFAGILNASMGVEMRKSSGSDRTMKLQKDFLRALKLQILIPIVILIIPAIINTILEVNNFHIQGINCIICFIFSAHGASSTLLMLYLQRPYKKFCLKILNLSYNTENS
ncbi:Serpentine Receptor, class H [Caenorhabditis elegans]|uniref:Serpentine Receptor, class H n=1 Tax=Caenorhabditis elegans TaxID=6239 RepID=O45305_CAEEL|nr:Serpentine Receptor, class H [Caenorhabditis elegans]CAB03968.2 Serpentine Receptor, class H [Caenorhabditis elegans]|eukprot:NP_507489.2 Serpentine Receptor, class H [Caenorhabditis elegans]